MFRHFITAVFVAIAAFALNHTELDRGLVFFIGHFSGLGFAANEIRLATTKRQGCAE